MKASLGLLDRIFVLMIENIFYYFHVQQLGALARNSTTVPTVHTYLSKSFQKNGLALILQYHDQWDHWI